MRVLFLFLAPVLLSTNLLLCTAAAQTELGSEDDLTVLGTDGTAADPDTEIKGFTVFGSTQAAYAGAIIGAGNVVVNGVLAVSSGAYFVGNSTFPAASKIFINDGSAGQVLSKHSDGHLQWNSTAGDDLGSHVATTTLNMASFNLVNVSSVNFRSNVFITSAAAAQQGGVYVSTNLFVAGISSATRYYGDGSPLANVTTSYMLGQYFGGGRIFWIDPSGKNVLIAATADQSSNLRWGDYGVTGATLDGVHAGKTNTVLISNKLGPGSYAARLCQDYAVSANGVYYDDWYLPSLNELWGLYAQKTLLGIPSNPFWSSTEADSTYAWVLNFSGSQYTLGKDGSRNVRCVRGGPVSAFDHSRDAETARQLQAAPNVVISSETSALLGAGVRVSTNIYIVGFSSAAKYYGDGSGLTNLPAGPGDNLGSHVATTTLQMGAYGVNSSSAITAAYYQINGSTVLAVLTGTGSLGVGGNAGRVNTGINNSFFGRYAGALNTTGGNNSFLGASAGDSNTTGENNSFVGSNAGHGNTTGVNNSFLGYQAGYDSTTGGDNSFLGYRAGFYNTTGGDNSLLGSLAGFFNQTGSANTLVGYSAGEGTSGSSFSSSTIMGYNAGLSLTTGSDNLLLGYRSGDSLTTGSRNIILGYDKDAPAPTTNDYINIGGLLRGDMAQSTMTVYGDLYADHFIGDGSGLTNLPAGPGDDLGSHVATTTLQMGAYGVNTSSHISAAAYQINGSTVVAILPGNNNIAFGVSAGSSTAETGEYNVFLGNYAGQTNTSGDYNTAVGHAALYKNYSGGGNTAGGYRALYNNTNGNNNTGVGHFALNANIGGLNNTSVGYNALYANSGGDSNTAVGYSALRYNTAGNYNTANGSLALFFNTASGNTASGYQALYNNTSGTGNTSGGYAALYSNVTGAGNTADGYQALYSNDAGGYNTAIGQAALYFSQAGSSNTVVGYYAGYGASGNSSTGNTFVGHQSGYAVTTGSTNTFVGAMSGAQVTAGGNNIMIGGNTNPAAPTDSNKLNIGNVIYGDLSSGNIGISINAPEGRLDVKAAGTAPTDMAQIWRDGGGVIRGSMSATGYMKAVKFIGDGSGLTNLPAGPGDNLGNHNATTRLNMGNYAIWSSSDITAARYQINGSTVLAILPGADSLGVGPNAGRISTGGNNSFVGSRAGYSNTSGAYNTYMGFDTGSDTNSGGYNALFGANAGNRNTTGQFNAFLGYAAGFYNAGANNNAIVGDYAGFNNTGSDSSFIGSAAGYNNTGRYNAFVGKSAGYSNTSGEHNAFIGSFAGNFNQTGSYNAILGHGSGGHGSGAVNSFSNSTIMGYQAGYYLTTGAGNIFLGWHAGYNTTTGAGNVVLGYDQQTSAPGVSNELNIGGVLYGNLSAKTIGISTRAPQAALDIVSTGTASNVYAQIWRDSSGLVVASMTANGKLSTLQTLPGDDLGNHIATTTLNMAQYGILNVASMTVAGKGLQIGTDLTSSASGVFISSYGSVMTLGAGHQDSVAPGARGVGAVDLQTYRNSAAKVASGPYSTVSGGKSNTASGEIATVSGGWGNTASGQYSTVSGGYVTTASGVSATVSGGNSNTASNSYATASGGYVNTASGNSATVSGGDHNTASGIYATVSGGRSNTASVDYATVSGGYLNTASEDNATVSGGVGNTASGETAVVSGGYYNTASGYASVVSGGDINTASGDNATVSGGWANTALGGGSWAGGSKSSSTADGSFTWSDSQGVLTQNNVADRTVFKTRGGFLVTGSTNTAMSGTLNRGMLVTGNGLVGISTGAPQAALDVVSTGTADNIWAQIWRNSSGVEVASMTSTGKLYATLAVSGAGDNLGNHTATQALNMSNRAVDNVSSMTITGTGVTGASPLFKVAGSTLTALNNGNVGIGTDSPGYPLEVKPAGMAGFQVEPQAGYVSLRVNGVEVARLEP